jgi:hypothetical protein
MRKKLWLENLKGRDHSEDLNIDGSITLKWKVGWDVSGLDSPAAGKRLATGCVQSDEKFDSIKGT